MPEARGSATLITIEPLGTVALVAVSMLTPRLSRLPGATRGGW